MSAVQDECGILAAWQPRAFPINCCMNVPSVSCTPAGKVMRLSLPNNNYSGVITTELGRLTSLSFIEIFNNLFTGTIPTEFGQLSSLTYLSLDGNKLAGAIPTEIARLGNLRHLDLHDNLLTGTVPTKLGQLSRLNYLNLKNGGLVGNIPTELGMLAGLTLISFERNNLTGSIPTEFGRLANLTSMDLRDNKLSGTVPTELGQLTSLTDLFLNDNKLTGTLPCEMAILKWQNFNFAGNQILGPVTRNELTSLCISVSKTSTSTAVLAVTSVSGVVKPSTSIPTSTPALIPAPDLNPSNLPMIAGISGGVALFLALLFLWFRKNKHSKNLPDLPTDDVYLAQETNPSISETSVSMSITLQPPPALYSNNLEKNSAYRQTIDTIQSVEFLPTVIQPSTSPPKDAIGTNSTSKISQLYDTTAYTTVVELESLHTQTSSHDNSSSSTAFNERYRSELLGSIFGSSASGCTKSAESKVDRPVRALTLRENRDLDTLSQASLPEDPKLWTQEQTAQWVYQKFGDVELLSSVMREKLTGRTLLRLDRQDMVSGLGLATVGERLLFEEAVDELRRRSAEQNAFAEEQPPSYM